MSLLGTDVAFKGLLRRAALYLSAPWYNRGRKQPVVRRPHNSGKPKASPRRSVRLQAKRKSVVRSRPIIPEFSKSIHRATSKFLRCNAQLRDLGVQRHIFVAGCRLAVPLRRGKIFRHRTPRRSPLVIDAIDWQNDSRLTDVYGFQRAEDYTSGVMVIAKWIRDQVETRKEERRGRNVVLYKQDTHVERPAPSSGSLVWRARAYSQIPFNYTGGHRALTEQEEEERALKAYGTVNAFAHRSRPGSRNHGTRRAAEDRDNLNRTEDLLARFTENLSKKADTRNSSRPSQFQRKVPLIKKGAEGRLLVPDVKLNRFYNIEEADGDNRPGSQNGSPASSIATTSTIRCKCKPMDSGLN